MSKYVHFIGICGTTMAPAAKMMQDMDWKVTGSDKGFYPPVSDYLKENNMVCMPGFKASHITNPDLIVVGNAINLRNIELIEAQKKGIPVIHYPQLLKDFLIKENSIVIAGTYGKTTTTALVTWILEKAGFDPSFMIGGIALNFKDGIKRTESSWSILEGDEYNAAKYDPSPKFVYYNPKYVILSSASWDHIDLYPTLEEYVHSFVRLVEKIPEDGLLVVKEGGENLEKIIPYAKCKVIKYSPDLFKVIPSIDSTFLEYNGRKIKTKLIGNHNVQNISAGFTLTKNLGVDENIIIDAIETFRGVKRRLEVRGEIGGVMIIDDLAHSAVKAKASVDAIKGWYPNKRIWAVFEPHTMTARTKSSMDWFKNSFDNADFVIIGDIYRGASLSDDIKATSEGIIDSIENKQNFKWAIKDTDEIVNKLSSETKEGDIILFMSSGGFGGVIQKTLSKLRNEKTN